MKIQNIVVEHSSYSLENMGDLAMLTIALARLTKLYPSAKIGVFTSSPDVLNNLFKNSHIYSLSINYQFILSTQLFFKLLDVAVWLEKNKNVTKLAILQLLLKSIWKIWLIFLKIRYRTLKLDFIKFIAEADLIIATGGGYITDSFDEKANLTLSILGLAILFKKPTLMFGHGIGPIKNPNLASRATNILPYVDFISLREGESGLNLLESFGVSLKNVIVTGDDAIELAHRTPKNLGGGIGINIRIADYSKLSLNNNNVKLFASTLQKISADKSAPLIPIIIEFIPSRSDLSSLKFLNIDYVKDDSDNYDSPIKNPEMIVDQVSKCRLVITGSYHAGVFALSQGIPIIGLVNSDYYKSKFLGLSKQFQIDFDVLSFEDEDFISKLLISIERNWELIFSVKDSLREAAKKQIELSSYAYKKAYEIISKK